VFLILGIDVKEWLENEKLPTVTMEFTI